MYDEFFDYTTYLSPLTWRYGSKSMRAIWSEFHKRLLWRKIWVALAHTQFEFGIVTQEQLVDLRQHENDVDLALAFKLESEIHHDLMAELKVFASQCASGGSIIHLGATSMDIEDNADVLRLRQALSIIIQKLGQLLILFADQIERFSDLPVIGFTHLQPAAATTLGYRLSLYAQDLLQDWHLIKGQNLGLKAKGFKGAVGTSSTYIDLVGIDRIALFESRLSQLLDLEFFPISGQTYPRKQDYEVLCSLAGLGASLHKFAFDLRVLQSPPIGEIAEPFTSEQVGSSAMPFKRNPIQAERINSLSRSLAQLPRIAWDNAANSLLERTLDDSANRRSLLAESCLICDEILMASQSILSGLRIDQNAINRNLQIYTPFSATEKVLTALTKCGADRQMVHERIRLHSMKAWDSIQNGAQNPLSSYISEDETFHQYISKEELLKMMGNNPDVGNAPYAARKLAAEIKAKVTDFE